jgi:hypothetical protein
LSEQKGKFELNRDGVKAMLQSAEVMAIAKAEAEKRGEITEEFVGTQRAWVKGREDND